ncbi:MAG: hypothetical protein RIQ89_2318 [Bacteroidota bacterium]
MQKTQLDAMIRLLDDTDEEIYNHIQEQLLNFGKAAIPVLETAWNSSLDAIMQHRIEHIIHRIQFEDLLREMQVWAETGYTDIIKGCLLVSRFQYPDLNEQQVRQSLEKIKRDAWLEMNDELTALEQVKVLNRIFFDIHGFSGNTQNYHAPQNSLINIALETKKGNPLMLSILYLEIAQSAGLPVFGVNLPEHFILGYKDDLRTVPEKNNNEILFYINPFSKGDIFGRKEIDRFLKQLNIPPDNMYYNPCNTKEMIQRLIRNLINSFTKLGQMDKVAELEQLMKASD